MDHPSGLAIINTPPTLHHMSQEPQMKSIFDAQVILNNNNLKTNEMNALNHSFSSVAKNENESN